METTSHQFALQVEGLHKGFNGKSVLTGVDLCVPSGSLFTVLGPSGSGKSVFLKCLANIIQASQSDSGVESTLITAIRKSANQEHYEQALKTWDKTAESGGGSSVDADHQTTASAGGYIERKG